MRDNDTLRTALRAIVNYRVEWFDHPPEEWAKHTPETCAECKRWRDMNHPIQHSCDGFYRLLYSRRDENARLEATQHYAMADIARAALSLPTGKAEGAV